MAEDEPTTIRGSLTEKELAEARASDAQAELFRAEALAVSAMTEAQSVKFQAEALLASAHSRFFDQEFARNKLHLEVEQRSFDETMAQNRFHHVYPYNTEISSATVSQCIDQLTTWTRLTEECQIEIIFNSPGGSIVDGLALFDFIRGLRQQGHHVTTTTIGIAASMAGVLLQAGTKRVMGRESWVLIHEASFVAAGSIGQVEDLYEWIKRVHQRVLNIFAERSTMTAEAIGEMWKRKDWWLSSDNCLELGFVDEVR